MAERDGSTEPEQAATRRAKPAKEAKSRTSKYPVQEDLKLLTYWARLRTAQPELTEEQLAEQLLPYNLGLKPGKNPPTSLAGDLSRKLGTIARLLRQAKLLGAADLLQNKNGAITEQGKGCAAIAEKVIGVLTDGQHQEDQNRLRIAAHDGIANYLLPYVVAELGAELKWKDRISVSQVRRATLALDLKMRRIDLALAWDEGIKPNELSVQPIKELNTELCLIYHPLYKRAQELKHATFFSSSRVAQHIVAEALGTHRIMHPDLPLAVQFAARLAPEKCVLLPGFPAVVNSVRMGLGTGLMIGWPWLLAQLEADYGLIHVPIKEAEAAPSHELRCIAYSRKSGEATDSAVAGFLDMVHKVAGALPPDGSLWHTLAISDASVLKRLLRKVPVWHGYFNTNGSGQSTSIPRPCEGKFRFGKKSGNDAATIYDETGTEERGRYALRVDTDGGRVIVTSRNKKTNALEAVCFLTEVLHEPDPQDPDAGEWMLVGTICFHSDRWATASPILLGSRKLDRKERRDVLLGRHRLLRTP